MVEKSLMEELTGITLYLKRERKMVTVLRFGKAERLRRREKWFYPPRLKGNDQLHFFFLAKFGFQKSL